MFLVSFFEIDLNIMKYVVVETGSESARLVFESNNFEDALDQQLHEDYSNSKNFEVRIFSEEKLYLANPDGSQGKLANKQIGFGSNSNVEDLG